MMTGGHAREDDHWKGTLQNLAARFGATGEASAERICVDSKRQWRQVGNIKHNAAIRTGLWSVTHPMRMLRRLRD